MDIRAALLEEHSKEQTLKIVEFIGEDQDKLKLLMNLFLDDEYRVTQRAAWVVGHYFDKHLSFMEPYIDPMFDKIKDPKNHIAVRRNVLRLFQEIDLPEHIEGEIFELCYGFLVDAKEPIAVRVFSMGILFNIVKKIPELGEELKLAIEDHLPHGSSGFKSRGKKILKAIAKMSK